MRAAHARHELDPEEGELNLTPYLDLVINLVVFLMASMMAIGSLRLIDIEAPAVCSDCPDAPRRSLPLTLTLSARGALIASSDGSVPSELLPGPLDDARLTEALASWKQRYGLDERITVSASADLPYVELVRALDAAREDAGAPLFPQVSLAVAQQR